MKKSLLILTLCTVLCALKTECYMEVKNKLKEPVLFQFSSDLKPEYQMILPSGYTWKAIHDQGILGLPHIKRRYKVYILEPGSNKKKQIKNINTVFKSKSKEEWEKDYSDIWKAWKMGTWKLIYDQPVDEGGNRGVTINYDLTAKTPKVDLDTRLI